VSLIGARMGHRRSLLDCGPHREQPRARQRQRHSDRERHRLVRFTGLTLPGPHEAPMKANPATLGSGGRLLEPGDAR